MEFYYKAKKGLNDVLEGTIQAPDKDSALNMLIEKGLFVVNIQDASSKKSFKSNVRRGRIGRKDILFFVQRLAILTRAKVELLTALKILYTYAESKKFKDVILQIYNLTKEGKTFSQSLESFSNIFPPLMVSIIRAGEESGRLSESLAHINDYMSREANLRSKVAVALAYPSFLLVVGLLSIVVLMNFIVPRMAVMLEGIDRELPVITKIILKLSDISGPVVLGVVIGIVALFIIFRNTGLWKFVSVLKRRIPVVKKVVINQELVSFSRALDLLLRSGVSTLKALEIASRVMENQKMKEELQQVCSRVAKGDSLSKSMSGLASFPDFFVKMISLGEESGKLSGVLDEIVSIYTQEVEKTIGFVSSLLEPVLILFLGGILGLIVFSILLPIFEIVQSVQ